MYMCLYVYAFVCIIKNDVGLKNIDDRNVTKRRKRKSIIENEIAIDWNNNALKRQIISILVEFRKTAMLQCCVTRVQPVKF